MSTSASSAASEGARARGGGASTRAGEPRGALGRRHAAQAETLAQERGMAQPGRDARPDVLSSAEVEDVHLERVRGEPSAVWDGACAAAARGGCGEDLNGQWAATNVGFSRSCKMTFWC